MAVSVREITFFRVIIKIGDVSFTILSIVYHSFPLCMHASLPLAKRLWTKVITWIILASQKEKQIVWMCCRIQHSIFLRIYIYCKTYAHIFCMNIISYGWLLLSQIQEIHLKILKNVDFASFMWSNWGLSKIIY